jgi:4-hydroxythreonine-4-phosphate dehydrogenase
MKPKVAITLGDPSGAGPEIALMVIEEGRFEETCRPVLVGDALVVEKVKPIVGSTRKLQILEDPDDYVPGCINLVECGSLKGDYAFAKIQASCGEAAYAYVKRAIELALAGKVDATVTGPLHKEALNLAGHDYAGHTEIFTDLTRSRGTAMLLVGGPLRVIHESTHVSLREACDRVTKERVLHVIRLADGAMRGLGIENPRIAVLGLNPHSGEHGLFGTEEMDHIVPAIEAALDEGFDVTGPLPPDTAFLHCKNGRYDIAVVMYHDQGHIPLKLLDFMGGVNITVGLPIIRTSVDHGTVFGKAGKGTADPTSLRTAIEFAVRFARHRIAGRHGAA